ncbi:hypothetical protein NHQ30_005197 [Ciborinia camelliae]|nr:hypothetical protein NHQ30_005197 [Ciborinia camelliae]
MGVQLLCAYSRYIHSFIHSFHLVFSSSLCVNFTSRSNASYRSLTAMNYPWRSAAAQNINADSAASTSSPSERSPKNLPITVGTVASRVLFLQKLTGNQKNTSPPTTPSRFPQTRPTSNTTSNTRRERSNKSPQRSRSPPDLRPRLNRRENSRSSFGRRSTNIFGNPASRNSQPNEQPQTGTNHSFLGLQTPRSNHDEGHARARCKDTPQPGKYTGAPPGDLNGMVRECAPASFWAPVTETLKMTSKNRNQKTAGQKVDIHRGIQHLDDNYISKQSTSNPQVSPEQNMVSSLYCQEKKTHRNETSNSEISVRTTSTNRRKSVRDLFDTYNIERPPGLASSEVMYEEVNKPQRHRVCHVCMWIHDKNENTCWKCGHRLCKACDRLSPLLNGGKEPSLDYNEILSGNRPKPSKSGPYTTTPRPSKEQIRKRTMRRPLPIPLQPGKKYATPKERPSPTEPFPPFYPKKSPPQKNSTAERGPNSIPNGLLHSCPGIYKPEDAQKPPSKLEDAPQVHHLHPVTESFSKYITKNHGSESQPPPTYHSRCESCQPADHGSLVYRQSTSHSPARSDDVVAMDGGYTADNSNYENKYRSQSYPDSSKASQLSTRFYRVLNGSIHGKTQVSHDSDHREIPRTSTRSYEYLNDPIHLTTQPTYEFDHAYRAKAQSSPNLYRFLNGSTYQPVQPNYGSEHTENSQPLDNFYPFPKGSNRGAAQPKHESDYVECHGYPRTGHWDCDRSPVSSGILGDCQHCLDDCECSACQSTVHSVRCCTNEIHKPMIHHHHSPAKTSVNVSYISDAGHGSSEQKRKSYILSRSQTYDRSTLRKYDSVSEWLENPDERLDTTNGSPVKAVHALKSDPSTAIGKANDSPSILQTPSSWTSSLRPIIPKGTAPLMKKALNNASQDAGSKAIANPNRPSSSDGTEDQAAEPISPSRFPKNSSPNYFSCNPWRERESLNFPASYSYWKQMTKSKSPLHQQQVTRTRRSTDCETSDICGQSEWAEQRRERESSEAMARRALKERFEREWARKKVNRWDGRRSESRRGRDFDLINTTGIGSEMTTSVGGYFDAKMRWCSSGSVRGKDIGRREEEEEDTMGSIVEEEVVEDDEVGENTGDNGIDIDNGDGDAETHDCIWRRRIMDLDERDRERERERERDLESRDQDECPGPGPGASVGGKERVNGVGGVKRVTIVVRMQHGEDLVMRMDSKGGLSWEGLERLVGAG